MSINSIEVRIHLTYKFNLRLSNFILNSSIHAIFKFLSPIYFELYCDVIRPRLLTAFSAMQHAVKTSPMDVVKSIFGKKLLSVCAGYRPGESLWVHSNGVNGKPTFHRQPNLSWLSKICNRFGEIDSGSRKSLTSIKPKWRFFGKKDPLRANFHNVFQKPHRLHGNTSFCANFVKFGRPEVGEIARCLMDEKKQNFGSLSRSSLMTIMVFFSVLCVIVNSATVPLIFFSSSLKNLTATRWLYCLECPQYSTRRRIASNIHRSGMLRKNRYGYGKT